MRKLVPYDAHTAVCRDANGDDCLVYARSDDKNAIMKVRISDGQATMLLDLGWAANPPDSMAVNISACDLPFVLVATYGRDKSVKYANQLLKVPLDGSAPEVICDSPTVLRSDESHPKASLSRDGSMAVFRVDTGAQIDTWLVVIDKVDTSPVKVDKPPTLTEIDFTRPEYAHRKWRLEQEMEVIDGHLVITGSKMFDRT